VQAACSTSKRTTRNTASRLIAQRVLPVRAGGSSHRPRHRPGPARPNDASCTGALALTPRPPPAQGPPPAPRPPPAEQGARGRRRQTVAPRRRWCRTTRKGQTSSRPPIGRCQPWSWRPWVAVQAGVRRAHAIQDFGALLSGSSAKLACARGYAHIEVFHDSISETG
jgi:hypothetical protein